MKTLFTSVSAAALIRFAADGTEGGTPTTQVAGQPADAPKPPKAKTVADDMDSRAVFADLESGAAYLTRLSTELSDFTSHPFAATGFDPETGFDEAIYTDETEMMVSTLRKAKGGVKAIVVAAVPTLDALLANEAGRAWVQRIIHKELNHVLVRPLRDAEDVNTVTDQMPVGLDAFISTARDTSGTMLESYNELYKDALLIMNKRAPVFGKAKLSKNEFKKALESKGYAAEFYPQLEERKDGSLFLFALNLFKAMATKKGHDAAIFDRWIATRDQKTFDATEENLDVDSMLADM